MQKNKIDINCARATHNDRIDDREVGQYTFFGGNDTGADEKRGGYASGAWKYKGWSSDNFKKRTPTGRQRNLQNKWENSGYKD